MMCRRCIKIRFESLTDKSKLDAQPELSTHIALDEATPTLMLIDSGIGMAKSDLLVETFS
jgi:molecular chaperone HtpG